MEAWPVAAATEPFAHPDFGGEVMQLKLAPGSTSGFKGVHKAGKKWEARRWVAGRGTRVVWRSSSPHECAFILARLNVYPCEIPTPKKGRAKPGEGQVRRRACSGSVCVLTLACSYRSRGRLASGRSAQRQWRRGASVDRWCLRTG